MLTVWIVGDYLTLSTIDPKEFIVSDSYILEITIERGSDLDPLDPDAARSDLADAKADCHDESGGCGF